MSFSDLFDSEFKQRNKGHFSAIVRVALVDGNISAEEKTFLDKLSRNLDISELEYIEILENPLKYPINAPYLHIERLERLFDLARMVHIEHHLGDKQDVLLRKISLALGFAPDKVDTIVDKAFSLINEKADSDTFITELEHLSK